VPEEQKFTIAADAVVLFDVVATTPADALRKWHRWRGDNAERRLGRGASLLVFRRPTIFDARGRQYQHGSGQRLNAPTIVAEAKPSGGPLTLPSSVLEADQVDADDNHVEVADQADVDEEPAAELVTELVDGQGLVDMITPKTSAAIAAADAELVRRIAAYRAKAGLWPTSYRPGLELYDPSGPDASAVQAGCTKGPQAVRNAPGRLPGRPEGEPSGNR
jgi:hypothetical protein